MKPLQIKRLPKWVIIYSACFCLTACSLFSLEKTTRYEDPESYFYSGLMGSIKADETSEKWLMDTFGRPLYSIHKRGLTIHTWQFSKQKKTKGDLFFLIRYRKSEEQAHYLHAIIQKQIVLKAWRDDFKDVDVDGAMGVATTLAPAPVDDLAVIPKKIEPADTKIEMHAQKAMEPSEPETPAAEASDKQESNTAPEASDPQATNRSLTPEEQIAVQDALLKATVFNQ